MGTGYNMTINKTNKKKNCDVQMGWTKENLNNKYELAEGSFNKNEVPIFN